MKKESVLRTLRFIFVSIVLFVLTFSAVVVTVLNVYVPKYLAKIEENEVGYFSSPAEFDEVYEKLVEEKEADGLEVEVYLNAEPTFELAYVRDGVIEEQNQYTNLRAFVQTEYTIYNVSVKDSVEMTFASKKEADDYAKKLTDSIKSTVSVEVKTEKVNELATFTDAETAKKTYDTLVSRYKPVVRTYSYVYTSTSSYGTASGELGTLASGGRNPTNTGLTTITQYYGGAHTGMDIASYGHASVPIYAYKAGVVGSVGYNDSYGYYVMINHGTTSEGTMFVTLYAHLYANSACVSAGQEVALGQQIANMGTTGNSDGVHLHLEFRVYPSSGSMYYLNPYSYIY